MVTIHCFSLQGNRDENHTVDYQKAQQDAQRLYQAGEGKLGTDESCFNMILASRSFPQLKATVEAYSQVYQSARRLGGAPPFACKRKKIDFAAPAFFRVSFIFLTFICR